METKKHKTTGLPEEDACIMRNEEKNQEKNQTTDISTNDNTRNQSANVLGTKRQCRELNQLTTDSTSTRHNELFAITRNIEVEQKVANSSSDLIDSNSSVEISSSQSNQHRETTSRSSFEIESVEETKQEENMPGVEDVHCPRRILRSLSEPDFDVWRLDQDSMVEHIEYMFHDLGVVRAWKVTKNTLRMFLLGVRERYQDNPYHNFKHCFCVTQMAYSMICKLSLRNLVAVDDIGALLTAAVCHDIDHPGLNNSYHSHARTALAILYNDQSILEQHHFAVTCRILSSNDKNLFRHVNNRDEVLGKIGQLILATDLARHKNIIEDYNSFVASGFDFTDSKHVMALLKVIIKCADVSNEVRPETIAGPWVQCLFEEYSKQSAREKKERLPVTPYMDPDLVNVSESQENFIRGMILPMFEQLSRLLNGAQACYVDPLNATLAKYEIQNTSAQSV